MSPKLLPCPFDGQRATIRTYGPSHMFPNFIQCLVCGARSGNYRNEELAALNWNMRQPVLKELADEVKGG